MENAEKSNEIFISYRRVDVDFTKKIYESLKQAEFTIWVDWDDIPPGVEGFTDEIQRGLEGSVVFICILSPSYLESEYCLMELKEALRLKKRIVPLVLKKFEPLPPPEGIGHINWVYFTPHAGQDNAFEESFPKVIQAIKADYAYSREHTKLFLRANEWQRNGKSKGYLLTVAELEKAERWQANAAGKNPPPTELHGEYILASRKDATRRQRNTLAGVATALVVSMVLGIVAFIQRQAAVRQSHISRAGELAAQAELLISKKLQGTTSLLLALEAMHSVKGFSDLESLGAQQALYDSIFYVNGVPLTGYHGPVSDLAFNPDGNFLATASKADNNIFVWDLRSKPAKLILLKGPSKPIGSLAFSPNGNWLAAGGEDNIVYLWKVKDFSHAPIVLRGHQKAIRALGFSPDGHWLATGSEDATARLWDMQSPDFKSTVLRGHDGAVNQIVFSPDGKLLATGSGDQTVRTWDLGDPNHESIRWSGATQSISALAFDSNSHWLAAGSWDGIVLVWNIVDHTRDPKSIPNIDGQAITDLAFNPHGNWLAIASGNNILRLWDAQNPSAEPLQCSAHSSAIRTLMFSPDGKWLATGSDDKTSIIWDVQDPANCTPVMPALQGHDQAITHFSFSPNGKWLATGSDDQSVRLWDLHHPFTNPALLQNPNDVIYNMAFSPDRHWLVTGGTSGETRLWNSQDYTNILLSGGHSGPIASLAFSPNGQWLATGSYTDHLLVIWNIKNPSAVPITRNTKDAVLAIVFSPDSQQVLTATADNTVERWNIENSSSETLLFLQHQGSQIIGMALSADGNWLATENRTDNFVHLWDIHNHASAPKLLKNMDGILRTLAFDPATHKLAIGNNLDNQQGLIYVWDMDDLSKAPVVLRGHSDEISALGFSPNGHFLISGSVDRTIRLWDMNNTSNPIQLQNHRDGISALAFSPDGKTLIAADLSETIYAWNTNIDEMINSACKVAGRNLTISQWRQYGFAETYRATCPIWPIDSLAN